MPYFTYANLLRHIEYTKFLGTNFFRERTKTVLIFNELQTLFLQVFHSVENQRVTSVVMHNLI